MTTGTVSDPFHAPHECFSLNSFLESGKNGTKESVLEQVSDQLPCPDLRILQLA